VPTKEYLGFEAALSLIGALPPDEVVPLLDQRCLALEMRIEQSRAVNETAMKRGLPAIFFVEDDYVRRLLEAELDFTRQLADDIRTGAIDGIADWAAWHTGGGGAWAEHAGAQRSGPAPAAPEPGSATDGTTDPSDTDTDSPSAHDAEDAGDDAAGEPR
jgi:hypothetical protein